MSQELIEAMSKGAGDAVSLLKIMAHEKRLLILCSLVGGEMAVGPLSESVGLSQPTLSQHLAAFRHQGYVTTRRDAQTVYYRLNNDSVEKVIVLLRDLFCEEE